ncbi:hypothetical protein P3S68_031905 [Capsicum galapagoense]
MIVLPQSITEFTFNTIDDHCYNIEPTIKLSGLPKFLTKKPSMPEKMVGKVKSIENDMKSSPRLVGYEYVSYKNWSMSSGGNLPPSFETSKFGEPDRPKDSVKHLGRHCHQSRNTKEKKKEKLTYCHARAKAELERPNPPIPSASIPSLQMYAHPSSYPQYHAPIPQHRSQPPQIYQGTSKSKFHPRPEFVKRRKEKDNYTPIGEFYANLFQRLRQGGYSIEDCRDLKREIEKMIQDGAVMVQNIDSKESSSHNYMQTSG